MNKLRIELKDLTKSYGRRKVIKNLNYSFIQEEGKIWGVSGPNGSGKSTLLKLIIGQHTPTKGEVKYIKHTVGGESKQIPEDEIYNSIGFVAPYLVLYEEFSCMENVELISKIRGVSYNREYISSLLDSFKLKERRNDPIRAYSSGMKQRMKFIFALMHNPEFLILDEPTENLDTEGKEVIYRIIKDYSVNAGVILASNEPEDLELCSAILNIEEFK